MGHGPVVQICFAPKRLMNSACFLGWCPQNVRRCAAVLAPLLLDPRSRTAGISWTVSCSSNWTVPRQPLAPAAALWYQRRPCHSSACTSSTRAGRTAAGAISPSSMLKYCAPAAWAGASSGAWPCSSSRAPLSWPPSGPVGRVVLNRGHDCHRLLFVSPPRTQTAQPPPLRGTLLHVSAHHWDSR